MGKVARENGFPVVRADLLALGKDYEGLETVVDTTESDNVFCSMSDTENLNFGLDDTYRAWSKRKRYPPCPIYGVIAFRELTCEVFWRRDLYLELDLRDDSGRS